jgi:hypothetical protein
MPAGGKEVIYERLFEYIREGKAMQLAGVSVIKQNKG